MNATDVARNALRACFDISADSSDIQRSSPWNGASSRASNSSGPPVSVPITVRAGRRKLSMARPSCKFSGEYANLTLRGATSTARRARARVKPTGT